MSNQTQVTAQANDLGKQDQQCGPEAKWAAVIDDQNIPAPRRRVKVQVLLEQVNAKPGEVLVRDLNSEHDVVLRPEQEIDLAEGNVFYIVPECDAPKPTGGHAPAKMAFVVDDRPEETPRANETGRTLRDLFGLTPEVLLFRDYHSPHDQAIGLDDVARFEDGPVFYTRRHKPLTVTITINGKAYELPSGEGVGCRTQKVGGHPAGRRTGQNRERPDGAAG